MLSRTPNTKENLSIGSEDKLPKLKDFQSFIDKALGFQ
jgi:hypothetical protein